jgi:regulatory protein
MIEKRITAITAQKRNPDRVNVYLDGEYSFSLSRIVAAWLKPGKAIDQKQIEDLIEKDIDEKVLQSALKILDYQPRTEQEIRLKLAKKGFEVEKITAVIEKLRSSKVIRDDDYAVSWVENRNEFHPRSQRLIRYELRNKGIDNELIEEVLKNSANDQVLAHKAANKISRRFSGLEWQQFQKKMSAHLARRGFSYDVVSQTVKNVWNELQCETIIMKNEESGE